MEEANTVVTSSPSETASSSATVNSTETSNFQVTNSQVEMYSNNPDNVEVEMATGERVSLTSLKELLRRQLEYYFSRENLQTDEYLQSQMDSDGFVAISTVAKFNQVRRLTDNHNLVVEVLRESAVVQVDDAGEKVRSNPRSGVLILREIPESTPLKEFEELFSSENCPKFLRCEFAHNNSWYVLFESDADTQKAYQYLREEAKTFHGKPVMARIKAKAFTSAPFTNAYKNGAPTAMEAETYNTQNVNQTPQTPLQYTYTNVPNDSYNNQQVCPPFYPPTMLQTWAPTTPACVDLGTVLSVNGLSPQAAFRPLNNSSNRHNYASRDSEQSRYFNRNQSASYLQRQQLHQQTSFPNIVNANNCTFDYVPYASRSRNIHNFGVDMSFFTAPNLYYNKLPSIYPAHTSQTRHNPVIMPRNQVGIGAINSQDQSYLSVGKNASLAYSRDSGTSANASSKQGGENQTRENWMNANRQRNKRWWKENGTSNSGRNYSENSNGTFNESQTENEAKQESPKFDLETTSFPPLPGSACLETVDVYESRWSDIVKGTVEHATRDTKTQTSESALVCTTKDSPTITVVDEAVIPTDGAFTPPASPESVKEIVTLNDALIVENFQEPDDWEEYADSPNNSTPSNTSININSVVPEVQTTFSASNTPAFLSVSTNSMMNGSVTMTESATSTTSLPETEPITNVPSEIVNESKQTVKLPKAKQLDSLPKNRPLCDTPSPKNKTPDSSSVKNKFDTFKDRSSVIPKHSRTFSSNKESSFKERVVNDVLPPTSKTIEHNTSNKCASEVCSVKASSKRESNLNKTKTSEPESTLLSVNGHADSESTASSEASLFSGRIDRIEYFIWSKEELMQNLKEIRTTHYFLEFCRLLIDAQKLLKEIENLDETLCREWQNCLEQLFCCLKKVINPEFAEALVRQLFEVLPTNCRKSEEEKQQLLNFLLKSEEKSDKYLKQLIKYVESPLNSLSTTELDYYSYCSEHEVRKRDLATIRYFAWLYERKEVEKLLLIMFRVGMNKFRFSEEEIMEVKDLMLDAIPYIGNWIKCTLSGKVDLIYLQRRSSLQFIKELLADNPAGNEEEYMGTLDESARFLDGALSVWCELVQLESGEDGSFFVDEDWFFTGDDYRHAVEDFKKSGAFLVPSKHIWWQKYKKTLMKEL